MRDFGVKSSNKNSNHVTGRLCDNDQCNGALKDSIINFGESLNKDISSQGFNQGLKSDLMVCLGSSLRVQPANQMALVTKGDLVIVNLQKTILDKNAALVIHCKLDDFF